MTTTRGAGANPPATRLTDMKSKLATDPVAAGPPAGPDRKLAAPDAVSLSWSGEDVENRLGIFKAGRYTSPNKLLGGALAVVLTAAFFALLVYGFAGVPQLKPYAIVFIRPGNLWTTGPATFLFFWATALLVLKGIKLKFQQRALDLAAVPQHPEFVLNEASAKAVLERIHNLVDHPRYFILLNRIDRALSNLHNIGGLSDVSTILKGQAENDENQIDSCKSPVFDLAFHVLQSRFHPHFLSLRSFLDEMV